MPIFEATGGTLPIMAFGQKFAHGSGAVPKASLFKGKYWEPPNMPYQVFEFLHETSTKFGQNFGLIEHPRVCKVPHGTPDYVFV